MYNSTILQQQRLEETADETMQVLASTAMPLVTIDAVPAAASLLLPHIPAAAADVAAADVAVMAAQLQPYTAGDFVAAVKQICAANNAARTKQVFSTSAPAGPSPLFTHSPAADVPVRAAERQERSVGSSVAAEELVCLLNDTTASAQPTEVVHAEDSVGRSGDAQEQQLACSSAADSNSRHAAPASTAKPVPVQQLDSSLGWWTGATGFVWQVRAWQASIQSSCIASSHT
jgi:hypothetical protein